LGTNWWGDVCEDVHDDFICPAYSVHARHRSSTLYVQDNADHTGLRGSYVHIRFLIFTIITLLTKGYEKISTVLIFYAA
jgi:hypothetical protein